MSINASAVRKISNEYTKLHKKTKNKEREWEKSKLNTEKALGRKQ